MALIAAAAPAVTAGNILTPPPATGIPSVMNVAHIFNNDYYAEQEAQIDQIERALSQSRIHPQEAYRRLQSIRNFLQQEQNRYNWQAKDLDARMHALPPDQYELCDRYCEQYEDCCARAAKASILISRCDSLMRWCKM